MDPVVIGKVLGPSGREGFVEIDPLAPEDFLTSIKRVYLKRRGGGFEAFDVVEIRKTGKKILIKLKGFEDPEGCRQLSGAKLFTSREELPSLEEDSFYVFELEGMRVVTDRGRDLGRVVRVLDFPSYQMLKTDRDLLIPFVEGIVEEISREESRITVKDDRIP